MTTIPPSGSPYPILARIDAARGADARPFATDLQAEALERRARELTQEYWPEHVWLTGSISIPLLDAVVGRLEAERDALHERIHVVVVTEERSTLSA